MDIEGDKFRKYLLGQLGEREADEIELRIMSDPEFEGILAAAEDDLVEDHLDGVLQTAAEHLFADNYLVTPERRENVEFIRSLRLHAKAEAEPRPESATAGKARHLFERFVSAFSSAPVAAYSACAVVLLVAAAGYFWLRSGGAPTIYDGEYAALNAKNFGDLGQFNNSSALTILPGRLRGAGSKVNSGSIEPGGTVLVRLGLPMEFGAHADFEVLFARGSMEIHKFESLTAYDSGGGKELRFLLPGRDLIVGEYRFEVGPTNKSLPAMLYHFNVE